MVTWRFFLIRIWWDGTQVERASRSRERTSLEAILVGFERIQSVEGVEINQTANGII